MRILAVDTSSNIATAAVTENGKLLGEYTLARGKKHSREMMPMVSMLLRDLGLTPGEMDLFAVSSGPGSFTGLRIGITIIKTMAYVCKKPVVPVPTLDVLACNVPVHDGIVCPVIDARNSQVYTAVYEQKGTDRKRISEYVGQHINDLAESLLKNEKSIVFTGDGSIINRSFLKETFGERACFTPEPMSGQRALYVAYLADIMALSGGAKDSFEVLPFYLRQSQAERELENKLKGTGCNWTQ